MTDEAPMTAVDLLTRFQRMVRKQDYWRGYVGWDEDAPDDAEVERLLQEAIDALLARRCNTSERTRPSAYQGSALVTMRMPCDRSRHEDGAHRLPNGTEWRWIGDTLDIAMSSGRPVVAE